MTDIAPVAPTVVPAAVVAAAVPPVAAPAPAVAPPTVKPAAAAPLPAPVAAAPIAEPAKADVKPPLADMLSAEPAKPAVDPNAPPAEAPKYEFKTPEGVALIPEILGEFQTVAAAKNLTQEDAQGLVDLHVKAQQHYDKALRTSWEDQQRTWQQDIAADATYGGEKLRQTRANIAKVIDQLGPTAAKEFRAAMIFTGAGNNPHVFKALAHFAAKLTEGGAVRGSPPSPPKNAAQTMYGTSKG